MSYEYMLQTPWIIHSFDNETLEGTCYRNIRNIENTFILLHGIGGDSNCFVELITHILKNFPKTACITYDLRGHGNSSKRISSSCSSIFELHARDLLKICKELQIEDPIVLGHSQGGMIIQEAINTDPSFHPKQIFLISSGISTFSFPILRHSFYYLYSKISPHLSQKKIRRLPEEHLKNKGSFDYSLPRIYSDIKTTGFIHFLFLWLTVWNWKNKDTSKINTPHTIYIFGKYDRILLPFFQKKVVQTYLPRVRSYQILSNHVSVINHPEQISDIITQTL